MSRVKWMSKMGFGLALVVCAQLFAAREASAAQVMASCKPTEVAVWNNRAHVKCSAATSGIEYYAVQITASNAAEVDRFVNLTSSAIVSGHLLSMVFESTDLSAGVWGCQPGNCRRPVVYVLK
jgi:hypothetical protein